MLAYVLVDFDNLPASFRDAGSASLARSIDAVVVSYLPGALEVTIRLYGGWYDEAGLSNDGTRLTQEIGKQFPIPLFGDGGKLRYIRCEIASSLIEARADLFPATVRKKHGLDWYARAPHPNDCVDPLNCTIATVMKWSRGTCPTPTCPVKSVHAFTCNQQKLVDGLLCCDLLSLAVPNSDLAVFLVSEDDDLIPALVLAAARGASVWHVRTKAGKRRLYDHLLIGRGVKITTF